ncbi:MAG: glycosyltransferase family 1 protein [Thermoanaerobaculia bacterium]
MKILQITPHLPPPFEGVGTYATALAGALARRGIETRFLVPDRTVRGLSREIGDAETVLLHYAGYGYQRRGCPAWLAEGLASWRGRLVTVFHEAWASGPPWRSSFWLLPLQRRIAAALARRSSALATTLQIYADMLRPWAPDIAVMPVFSTVGEPERVPAFGERERRLVVFGGAGVRGRAYGPFRAELARAARELEAVEIVDVGSPLDLPAAVGGVPVRALGVLPAFGVGEVLLGSAAGFLAYPPDFLPKSTIFAAYCAHGLLPVCAWGRHPGSGPPYWTGAGDPGSIAAGARAWYSGHRLEIQAERFRDLLVAGSRGA